MKATGIYPHAPTDGIPVEEIVESLAAAIRKLMSSSELNHNPAAVALKMGIPVNELKQIIAVYGTEAN